MGRSSRGDSSVGITAYLTSIGSRFDVANKSLTVIAKSGSSHVVAFRLLTRRCDR